MKILDDAYEQGLKYDLRDMRPAVQNFALSSSHNADYCLRMVSKMKFASEEPGEDSSDYKKDAPLVFFDVEIFLYPVHASEGAYPVVEQSAEHVAHRTGYEQYPWVEPHHLQCSYHHFAVERQHAAGE